MSRPRFRIRTLLLIVLLAGLGLGLEAWRRRQVGAQDDLDDNTAAYTRSYFERNPTIR
jgi:hypothetical protein